MRLKKLCSYLLVAGMVLSSVGAAPVANAVTVDDKDAQSSIASTLKADAAAEEVTETTDPFQLAMSQGTGCYDSEFDLELSASEGMKIYYTLDGSAPTAESTEYTEPIKITDRKDDENYVTAVDPKEFDAVHLHYNSSTGEYTDDYSAPTKEEVDKATVVKAIAIAEDGSTSKVLTNTYFVGAMDEHIQGIKESCESAGIPLAIMSISVDYDDLFDYETGIYVRGKIYDEDIKANYNSWSELRSYDANYKQRGKDWERPAHIDYIESDGETTEVKLQQDCGIRIQGNYSRGDIQKGLRLYARDTYGDKNFNYPFFPSSLDDNGEVVDKYKKINLRNGGNCAFCLKYNDQFWQGLLRDENFDTQHSRACVVYIDGEYFGLYVFEEDYTSNLLQAKHGVDKDTVVTYKGDGETYGTLGYGIDDGEIPEGETEETDYYLKDVINYLDTHESLRDDADFEGFDKLFDTESVLDFFATEIWMDNKWDFPGKNWVLWRGTAVKDEKLAKAAEYSDSRWRFGICDLDFGGWGSGDVSSNTIKNDGYDTQGYGLLNLESENLIAKVFAYCMTNEDFQKRFNEKMVSLGENEFEPTAAINALDKIDGEYRPLYDQFYARYYGTANVEKSLSNTYNDGSGGYSALSGFINGRAKNVDTMLTWANKKLLKLGYGITEEVEETPVPEEPTNTAEPSATDAIVTAAPAAPAAPATAQAATAQAATKPSVIATEPALKTHNVKIKIKNKKIVIKCTKKAKVVVKSNKKIMKKGKKKVKKITVKANKNKKGKVTIKLSKKIKKGMKFTIKISKNGYTDFKKKVKI